MPGTTVLIVEDDPDIRELVSYTLTRQGYACRTAENGTKALLEIGTHPPGLLVLDLMLPGVDGLSLLKELKATPRHAAIPVIIVSAKGGEEDIVKGLELGADDYLAKPFSPKVLVARIKAILRNRHTSREGQYRTDEPPFLAGDLTIDRTRHKVNAGKTEINLTFMEFGILSHLASHPGRVFTRYQIVEAVRGDAYNVTDRSVDVIVSGLRKKMGPLSDYIETVRGIGYRFQEQPVMDQKNQD